MSDNEGVQVCRGGGSAARAAPGDAGSQSARSLAARRGWRSLVVATALLVAGAGAWQLWLRDSTTPLSVEEAVDEFRAVSAKPGASLDRRVPAAPNKAVTSLPPRGVYVYDTAGEESVDALGGARHDFPDESTITVSTSTCGVDLAWRPLEERAETWKLCGAGGALRLSGYHSFHRFFDQDDSLEYRCDPAIVLVGPVPDDAAPRHASCTAGELVEAVTVETVGVLQVLVDGRSLIVERVVVSKRLESMDGATTGSSRDELWLTADGRIATWIRSGGSIADSLIGDVLYKEHFRLDLRYAAPDR